MNWEKSHESFKEDFLDLLKSHRSVRKYRSTPVPDPLLKKLTDAARQASSSSNLQAYSLVKVMDPRKKDTLANLCGNQPWVAACPVFFVVCADLHRLDWVCRYRGYELNDDGIEMFIVAVVDAALVAQNLLIAAESEGLGGCMIGGIRNNPEPVCQLLDLPDKTFPVMGICIGYPDQDTGVKPRLPHGMVVHDETYSDASFQEGVRVYDDTIRSSGLYDGANRKAPALDQRIIPDSDYSWSEHTARRLASMDPKVLRTHMLSFLKSRNFKLG